MEYVVMYIEDNTMKVISRHKEKEEALTAGSLANKNKTGKGVISCVYGNVNDDGSINGKHYIIKTWIFSA